MEILVKDLYCNGDGYKERKEECLDMVSCSDFCRYRDASGDCA